MQFNYLETSLNHLDQNWKSILLGEKNLATLVDIDQQLSTLANAHTIYPVPELTFNALNLTPFDQVKIVIIGQDPYHGEGQACGLSFWVDPQTKTPPSLQNIYKELMLEYGVTFKPQPSLLNWAKSGVLLLNSTLTVTKDAPNSHAKLGWQQITDNLIKTISNHRKNVVFMLWGNYATTKKELIAANEHLILTTTHPSPFSAYRGFLGCNHFKLANQYLQLHNIEPIDWFI